MKKLRVMVLVREGFVPPDGIEGLSEAEIAAWKMEFDVIATLREAGHELRPLGVSDDLTPIRETIQEWQPHIAFMLLEEFHGLRAYDQAIVSYLELMRQPYTGCNPNGLMLTNNKALSKQILSYHRIRTPRFAEFQRGRVIRRPTRLKFPLLVKSLNEDASLGISQASIVKEDQALKDRVLFIHESVGTDALVEEYVDGRELYVGVLGNNRLQTFPVWEMLFSKMPDDVNPIATARVKFDPKYQKKHGIETAAAKDLPPGSEQKIARFCKRVYRSLGMSGYARMDLRMRSDGEVFFIEANANPNIEYGEDFAESAQAAGIKYEDLLGRIINLGLAYPAPWKTMV